MVDNQRSFQSELDRPSLLRVRDRYRGIQDLIGMLSVKVAAVASSAENEFLSAYRVHMLSIQSELKDLTDQVKKAEEQLNDDGQVAKLEHEVSWFKEEKLRLQQNTEAMLKDMKGMTSKLTALREQQKFLSDQLKSVMKRSRVLESEVHLMGNTTDNRSVHSSETNSIDRQFERALGKSATHFKPKPQRSSSPQALSTRQAQTSSSSRSLQAATATEKATSSTAKVQELKAIAKAKSDKTGLSRTTGDISISVLSKVASSAGGVGSSGQGGREWEADAEASRVESMIKGKVTKKTSVTSTSNAKKLNKLIQSRGKSEIALEDAIRDTFRGIIYRKVNITAQSSISRSDNLLPHGDLEQQLAEDSTGSGPGGITGLGLEHFTDYDRLDAMVRFLSDPSQFEKIVAALQALG